MGCTKDRSKVPMGVIYIYSENLQLNPKTPFLKVSFLNLTRDQFGKAYSIAIGNQ